MTFQELFDKWRLVKQGEVKPGTLATNSARWKGVQPHLADIEIGTFGRTEAKMLMGHIVGAGLSRSEVKYRMSFVKQLLLFAATELEQSIKPTEWNLKLPPVEPRRLQRFTENELMQVIKLIVQDFKEGNYRYLPIAISAFTGMRVGEVCGLKWCDVDFKHRLLYVCRNVTKSYDPIDKKERTLVGSPKTRNGYREIPLLPTLVKLLKAAGGNRPDPDCFVCSNASDPLLPGYVRNLFDDCIKRCKTVPRITFHGLRHTFATQLVECGSDIKTVSDILGHATIAITLELYVHPSIEAKRKAVVQSFRRIVKSVDGTPSPSPRPFSIMLHPSAEAAS